jgi:hypothetical protein
MGNTLTLLSNKVQYEISKVVSDPKAAEYAKEQADQAAQDKAVKESQEAKEAENAEQEKEDSKAEELSKRSKTDTKKMASNIAFWVIIMICVLILILIGIVAANDSIGYNTGFRVFWFVYGIPGVIYTYIHNLFVKDKKKFIVTSQFPFNTEYNETEHTKNAREKIIKMYEEGASDYSPSIKEYRIGEVKLKPAAPIAAAPIAAAPIAAAPIAAAPIAVAAPIAAVAAAPIAAMQLPRLGSQL